MRRTKLSPEDLEQIASNIWDTMFSASISMTDSPQPSPCGFLTGSIQISGAWEGVVVLRVSLPLARRLTTMMLGIEQAEDAELCDAIGELTNLTAGSVQALLPSPSELTPPSVIEGKDYKLVFPRCSMVNEVHLAFDAETISIQVFEAKSRKLPARERRNRLRSSLTRSRKVGGQDENSHR